MNFDLNTLIEPLKSTPLYDPDDALHYRFANTEKRVNLLREVHEQDKIRNGIYVQFEKNITEK